MKPSSSLLILIAAALTPATLTAVPAMSSPTTSAAHTAKLALSRSKLGSILVDNEGRTLYLFEKDKNRRSACSGQCAKYWPPLLSHGKPVARIGVKQPLLGVTPRANGRRQVTYAGHPLYRFVGDARPGQTKGEGLHDFGAGWDVLSPAGKKVESDG
jgi:predicted lipoprotein with Yx(FWY)xxD motif